MMLAVLGKLELKKFVPYLFKAGNNWRLFISSLLTLFLSLVIAHYKLFFKIQM